MQRQPSTLPLGSARCGTVSHWAASGQLHHEGCPFPWLQLFCVIRRDMIFLQGRSMLYTEGWSLGQLCTLPLNSVGKIPMSKSELGRNKALLKSEREGKSPAVVLSCLQRVSAFGAFYISAKPELSRRTWVWASFPADASNIYSSFTLAVRAQGSALLHTALCKHILPFPGHEEQSWLRSPAKFWENSNLTARPLPSTACWYPLLVFWGFMNHTGQNEIKNN